jgi:hypothetical protein
MANLKAKLKSDGGKASYFRPFLIKAFQQKLSSLNSFLYFAMTASSLVYHSKSLCLVIML